MTPQTPDIQRPSRPKLAWTNFKNNLTRLNNPFSSRRDVRRSTPRLDTLDTNANTISTNAWAGSSQSRGSIDLDTLSPSGDFIRVKQVIRQEREMQV